MRHASLVGCTLMSVLGLWACIATAATDPAARCQSGKVKATAKAVQKLTACGSDGTCVATAETKLTTKVASLEAKGGCPATGEGSAYVARTQALLSSVAPAYETGLVCSEASSTAGAPCTTDGDCPGGACVPAYCAWAFKMAGKNAATTLKAMAKTFTNPDQATLDATVAKADAKLQQAYEGAKSSQCAPPDWWDVLAPIRTGVEGVCTQAQCPGAVPPPPPPPPGVTTTVPVTTVPTTTQSGSTTTSNDSTTTSSSTTSSTTTSTTTTTIPCISDSQCNDGDSCTVDLCVDCDTSDNINTGQCLYRTLPGCVNETACCVYPGGSGCTASTRSYCESFLVGNNDDGVCTFASGQFLLPGEAGSGFKCCLSGACVGSNQVCP